LDAGHVGVGGLERGSRAGVLVEQVLPEVGVSSKDLVGPLSGEHDLESSGTHRTGQQILRRQVAVDSEPFAEVH
jgi:hypothetical protein